MLILKEKRYTSGSKTDFEFLVLQKIPNIYKSNAFKSDKKKNWT
jgi:hypothetical protein